VADRLVSAARILVAVDEQLRAGDRIITGSITQLPFAAGDVVRAEFASHASGIVTATQATRP
jgi:2-keto-4-pentenoate hydratase